MTHHFHKQERGKKKRKGEASESHNKMREGKEKK
jgi:hypothetical protein